MEISDYRELAVELEVEESGFMMNQWPITECLDELSPYSFEGELFNFNAFSHHRGFEPKRPADMLQFGPEKPSKLIKTESSLSSSSFGILMPKQVAHSPNSVANFPSDQFYLSQHPQPKKLVTSGVTKTSQAQDHIIAERRRREKMTQKFIALSAIIPGLKKMDKASVLGDAIKYLKQLQEKVKGLEEVVQKKSMESVVLVKKKKKKKYDEDDNGVSETLPEIEVKICSENVLIRVHCEKKKGIIEELMAQIQNFHLSIVNTNVLTFGGSTLDITILTKIDKEFTMTAEDLVTSISTSIGHIM